MNCSEARASVDAFVEGRLDARGAEELGVHCDACEPCRRAYDEARLVARVVGDSFRDARAGASARGRIMALIAGMPAPLRPASWGGRARIAALAAVAAAVALAAGGYLMSGASTGEGDAHRAPAVVRRAEELRPVAVGSLGSIVSGAFEIVTNGETRRTSATAPEAIRPGDTLRPIGTEAGQLALSDRVLVTIDAGSEVAMGADPAMPFDVRLARGRLFAEVETGTPFRVLTADGNVQSLGTKFAVSLAETDAGAMELGVTVEEGVVELEREGYREQVRGGTSVCLRRGLAMRQCTGEEYRQCMRWVQRHRARHGRDPGACPDDGCGRGGQGQGCQGQGQGQAQGQDRGQDRGQGPGQDRGR